MKIMKLYIPGPTRCPPEVMWAFARPQINHRGEEFSGLLRGATEKFKQACVTQNDVFFLGSSGTGAMEAAIVNFLSPQDLVLSVSVGYFGDKFADLARIFGAKVIHIPEPRGSAIDPSAIEFELHCNSKIKAVLVVHNETSTGVASDLESIARVVKGFDRLLIVDAMSSLGAMPVKIDEWGLDVVVSASQKAWMCPPGLSMIIVSKKAWEAHGSAKMPRGYFDLAKAKRAFEEGYTPCTPPIANFFALDAALDLMLKEGMENVFERHRRLSKKIRDGLRTLGLNLVAPEECASRTVTPFWIPKDIREEKLVEILKTDHDIVVGRGLGELAGKIIRIGHMGWVDDAYVDEVLDCLHRSLDKLRQVSRCCS